MKNTCTKAALMLAVVICITGHTLQAQVITGLNHDSLKREIALNPSDTSTVYSLIHLGQQYENNTPDSAVYFYKQANELSQHLHYPKGIISYINNYTAVLNVQGRFDEINILNVSFCKTK